MSIMHEIDDFVSQINEEAHSLLNNQNVNPIVDGEAPSLFKVKSANQWLLEASKKAIPKKLYKELWYEGEICILYAETNVGKSIHAVQIGVEIAVENPDNNVLYFDFELAEKQFEGRYSQEYQNHFVFPENFYRVEINPDGGIPEGDHLINSIEQEILKYGSKVIIVDNITYLGNENEKARDALPLMKQLKSLKNKYNISLLCLAHTPKRDLSKPITRNDLQGSKMLMNFCDSSFAIGESSMDKDFRYIKQIKERQTGKIYDAENIILVQIVKPTNYVYFEFIEYSTESKHLRQYTETDRENRIDKCLELSKNGKSQREISRMLGISVGAVNKYLNRS